MRAVPAVVGGKLLMRRPSSVLIFGSSDKLLVGNSFIFLFWTCSHVVRSGRQGHGCSVCGAWAGAAIDKDKVMPVASASVDSRLPDARFPGPPCVFFAK